MDKNKKLESKNGMVNLIETFSGWRNNGYILLLFLVFALAPYPVSGACTATGYTDVGGVCVPLGTGLSNKPIADIAYALMIWLFGIVAVVAIITFAVSGLKYMTAAGDEKQADTAKNTMKYAVIGIAVSLSGYIAITAISSLLSANSMF